MQAASSSQSTLERNCLTVGLKFHGETPSNGNCFFEAVSSQLKRLNCAVQKSPQQLRQDVVSFMKANRILHVSEGTIDLADFMDNETFDDYCVRMANDGEWADHVVVVAMARMLQTDIMIITSSPSTGADDNIVWVVGQTDFQGQPILLGHVWEYHYQSLQTIASVSLEPVLAGSPAPAPTNVPPQAQKLASTPDATAGSMSSPAALTTLAITSGTMLVSTYDPMPSITADVMQAPSSSSTAASLMQAPTYGSTQSTTTGPMLFTIFRTTTADVMQTVTSSFTTDNVMQTPAYSYTPSTTAGPIPVPTSTFTPSTTAGHMQSATSTSTSSGLMPAQTSGSIHSTTTGSMPSLTSTSTPSTTAGHMLGATSTSTAAGLVPAPTYGSTQSMTTGPMPFTTFSATTANVMQTVTSSTTTAGIMQAPASGYTPSTTASPIPGPTTASLIPAPTTTSTPSPTAGHTQSATSTSTAAGLMPAPTYGSTQSMTTGPKPFPTFSATTADIMQYPASGCTPSTTAGPIPAPTSNCTSSPTAGHMQSATSTSTAARLVPAPTSGSIPSPTSCSTPSTTGIGLAPTSSSTTADIAQAPTVDDADRFMHIACLLVNVGSRVLRRLLLHHTVTPACNLDQYLAKNRIAIDSLKKRRILNNSQMDILFPPGGTTNLGDYDITLLSALFNNIVSTITQQQLNMIQFLRDERNEIFAHARSITVNINDYQKFWNGIYTSLVALCKQCGDPDFENEILKEIQGIKMSTVQGTSFLDTLQTHPRRLETLERLVQALISSFTQESTRPSDDSDS